MNLSAATRSRFGRRQQILDAGAQLFADRGFHGVTVDDLGAAVGLTGPAIYHHFASKEELLGELLVQISEELRDGARKAVAKSIDPDAALDLLLRTHIKLALERSALSKLHLRETDHVPEQRRAHIRRIQAEYLGIWMHVLLTINPTLDRTTARSSCLALFALMNSTAYLGSVDHESTGQLLFRMGRGACTEICEARRRRPKQARLMRSHGSPPES
jgi:AcrR family transcriptional regulator